MSSERPTELWAWDAIDIAAAVASREVSSVEIVSACLDRLEVVNPTVNAVVESFAREALETARRADDSVARGDPLGPLHGVPVTVKVNIDQRGCATTNGIVAWRDVIAEADSPAVAGLRAAGAVIIGRTNTSSMSLRWTTENDLYGLTLNPWAPERTAGGSSGGASVAVATGIGPIAHGNDLFGSIRYPAFCSGVVGLRPTWGVTPYFNGSSNAERGLSFQTMAAQGPLTRCVRDLRPALTAFWGSDFRDTWSVPVSLDVAPSSERPRVALSLDPLGAGVHPAISNALREAAKILEEQGYIVEEADPPRAREASELGEDLVVTDTRIFSPVGLVDAPMHRQLELMLARRPALDIEAYVRAIGRRATLRREWAQFSEQYPVILCPTSTQLPYLLGEDISSQSALDDLYLANGLHFALPLIGAPGLALPTGFFEGVPLGVQLIGRRFGEAALIQAAEILESAFGVFAPTNAISAATANRHSGFQIS